MNSRSRAVLKQALKLPSLERAGVADELLSSLDKPDDRIDEVWRQEVEKRLRAYRDGDMETVSLEDVLAKYKIR